MIHQLRSYEIFDANAGAFLARFRDHAARIMRRHGFDLRAMWEARTPARRDFVCLLAWPGLAAQEAGWAAFMGDPEWQAIRAETNARHGALAGAIEDRVLTEAIPA